MFNNEEEKSKFFIDRSDLGFLVRSLQRCCYVIVNTYFLRCLFTLLTLKVNSSCTP